ncbi:hypothetical protein [Nissabacter sp. SGAir0207]|uniref:hypothetical protein n=1 Tax=Nissabacter sp. SGAir0207 TaxID=2126321 RepID=UPI0010CD1655|nr:hypothetical protein [Nissabacter sp. SGAir0207]QCR35678.1 hypothetical protein C1N62_06055 [Nissabacter sp. SGAir0207]
MTGVANPKDLLFFLSLFPQCMAVTLHFPASLATLALVWVLLDFTVLSLYILTVNCRVLARQGRRIEQCSAGFLLAASLYGVVYNAGALMLLFVKL